MTIKNHLKLLSKFQMLYFRRLEGLFKFSTFVYALVLRSSPKLPIATYVMNVRTRHPPSLHLHKNVKLHSL